MQIGMIGLGRMGSNMVRRLLHEGHDCVVYDVNPAAVTELEKMDATGAHSLEGLVAALERPRAIWMMVPAALVDGVIDALLPRLDPNDVVIDGGNSYYRDDIRRASTLEQHSVHYVDVGTSGGVFGLERGYCQMIGGEKAIVERLDAVFASLAPPLESAPPTPERTRNGTAERGYLHCGSHGAGHFVKMIHNGIEYGIMASFAEGFNLLKHAGVGRKAAPRDAETTPLRDPEYFQYDFDLGEIAEVWRRGSVISSWLLDLIAQALLKDATLDQFAGSVSDSGEGRWTTLAAVEAGVPVPILSAALYQRFSSRHEADFANRLLSAMRAQFGGHAEKT